MSPPGSKGQGGPRVAGAELARCGCPQGRSRWPAEPPPRRARPGGRVACDGCPVHGAGSAKGSAPDRGGSGGGQRPDPQGLPPRADADPRRGARGGWVAFSDRPTGAGLSDSGRRGARRRRGRGRPAGAAVPLAASDATRRAGGWCFGGGRSPHPPTGAARKRFWHVVVLLAAPGCPRRPSGRRREQGTGEKAVREGYASPERPGKERKQQPSEGRYLLQADYEPETQRETAEKQRETGESGLVPDDVYSETHQQTHQHEQRREDYPLPLPLQVVGVLVVGVRAPD